MHYLLYVGEKKDNAYFLCVKNEIENKQRFKKLGSYLYNYECFISCSVVEGFQKIKEHENETFSKFNVQAVLSKDFRNADVYSKTGIVTYCGLIHCLTFM